MSLSLSCTCGARLEVDDKFAGQTITCPDCNKPILAPVPPKPANTTSGLALASFILALAGAFTVVGTIAAMVCGFLGLREIDRSPEPMGGRNFARAGIIIGGIWTVLALAAFFTLERLGFDGFLLRSLELAGKIDYGSELILTDDGSLVGHFSIERPSIAWGKLKAGTSVPLSESQFEMTLVNVREDAQIVCILKNLDRQEPLEVCREKGQQMFQNSRLIKLLSRRPLDSNQDDPGAAVEMRDYRQVGESDIQEFYLDMRLSGIDRTFLVRVHREGSRVCVVAGGARKNRFGKLKKQIEESVESFNPKK